MKATAGPPVEGRPPRIEGSPHAHRARHVLRGPPDVLGHLSAVLPAQWRRYRKRLQRCRRKFSGSAVHDFRVETRRLLAMLELLTAFIPDRELEKPRRALKAHLDAFDHLRDTQVQLECMERMRRPLPAAQKFQAWLRKREVSFIRDARQSVKQIKTRRVEKRIAAIEHELRCQQKGTVPEQPFLTVRGAIRVAFARVVRLSRRVNAADPKAIHRTRIAFKRFRYMVDELAPLLPAVTDKHLQAMHSYQTMMGDIQDSKVLLAALDKFIKHEDNDPATQRLWAEFVRRREQLIRVYVNAAPRLWLFWPPKKWSPGHATKTYRLIP